MLKRWSGRTVDRNSAIGLFLGREGRDLLRSDLGLEDWFELLDVSWIFLIHLLLCKNENDYSLYTPRNSLILERRSALRSVQEPRSRVSLAAPPSHASHQSIHMGHGGPFSSALEDWLLTHQKIDSLPDLTGKTEISTNQSTPQRVPMLDHRHYHHQLLNTNSSRYSVGYPLRQNSNYSSSVYGTPLRQHQLCKQQQHNQFSNNMLHNDDDNEFDGIFYRWES